MNAQPWPLLEDEHAPPEDEYLDYDDGDRWEAIERVLDEIEAEAATRPEHRLHSALEFLYGGSDDEQQILLGVGDEVLHARGEATLIAAVTGAGKSTFGQNYVAHRTGVFDGVFLGYPVSPLMAGEAILYVAADRPKQIKRSFRRLVTKHHAERLAGRLVFHKGPLPFLLNRKPEMLLEFIRAKEEQEGVRIVEVILDSLKDVASELAKPEGGEGVQRALGLVIAEDIDVIVLHHERKPGSDKKEAAPPALAQIYGAQQLTACMGNVLYLDGPPGGYTSVLHHLKQSNDTVGPLHIDHDHDTGVMTAEVRKDLWKELQAATKGMTVRTAAEILAGSEPSANDQKRAYRRLRKWVTEDRATCNEPLDLGPGFKVACLFFPV